MYMLQTIFSCAHMHITRMLVKNVLTNTIRADAYQKTADKHILTVKHELPANKP